MLRYEKNIHHYFTDKTVLAGIQPYDAHGELTFHFCLYWLIVLRGGHAEMTNIFFLRMKVDKCNENEM